MNNRWRIVNIAFIAFFDPFFIAFLAFAFAWTGHAGEWKATRALISIRTMR